MTHHIIISLAAIAISTMLLMGCVKDNDGIVGEWQWTGTTMHHVNSYMGQDTTENWNFPIYKDLTFHEGGQVDILQQGIYFP